MRICKREGSFDRGIYYHLLVALSCRRCRSTRNVCAPRNAEHDILLVDSISAIPSSRRSLLREMKATMPVKAMAAPSSLQWYLTE